MNVGDRVLLVATTDPWVEAGELPPGTCGTVSFIDSMGTVFVDWDNGSRLGMVEKAGDRFVRVDPRLSCEHESRGGSRCRLPQGHTGDPDREKRLHSDLTLLWRADGELCNLDGRLLGYSRIPGGCVCEWENLLAGWEMRRRRADCPVHGEAE